MIDFRYHVVSIVAVFLALALGLFIGSTTLRPTVARDLNNRVENVTKQNATLIGERDDARKELSKNQSFDAAVEPYAVQGRLVGQSVVVVSAPGVDNGLRSDVMTALTDAGATLDGDIRLQDTMLDPAQEQFLGTLADKVAIPGRQLPNGSGAVRALALLADVLVTKPQAQSVSRNAATRVVSAYSAGKLLTVSGDTPQTANLAVVIAAPAPSTTSSAAPGTDPQSLVATFARDLDRQSAGVVVAGATTVADQRGLVDVIRSDKSLRSIVSTVDNADVPSGVIATVLALAEQAGGRAGSYGIGPGEDAPLPSPSPS